MTPFLSRPARTVERSVAALRGGLERQTRDGPDRREGLEGETGDEGQSGPAAGRRAPAAPATATVALLLAGDRGVGRGGGGLLAVPSPQAAAMSGNATKATTRIA
jgi:hypothetical protein